MKYLSLSIPWQGGQANIAVPSGVPTGGLYSTGETILQNSMTILLILVILFALIFFIIGGIQWSMSGGDKEAVQKARNKIIYALVGLVLALLALFIVNFIGGIFGVNLIRSPFEPQH